MESITMLLILLLLVAAVTAVIACLAIYNRKRRQFSQPPVAERPRQTTVDETQPTTKAEAKSPLAVKQHLPVTEEETQFTPVEETQAGTAPEAQPMSLQAAEPMVVAHTQPAEVEGTQPIVVKKLQPPVAEETQATAPEEKEPTVAEEAKPQVAEEVQPIDAKEEVSLEVEGGRRKPGERGGRPRGPAQGHEEGPIQETRPHRPKPEIVCWKRERQWIAGVEVPEDLLANSGLAVLQNTLPLTQDKLREGCWCLKETYGQVVVQWNEDEVAKEIKVVLGEESYLLFKLSGQDQKQGRRVKSPSFGSYLVMVPDNWGRDDALSGPPPAAPEPVSVAGYKAHFFDLEKDGDGKIVFHRPINKQLKIEPRTSRFELVGTRLNDASEYVGPLFGDKPPKIRALDDQGWKDVGTIVVGEEGSGIGRWRRQFNPVLGRTEQDLPPEVADRKGGWFFLRFYDTNDDLIESLDFRFISVLREIKISQPPPLPSEDGHRPVYVEFLHEPCCAVQAADGLTNIQIERQDDKTTLTISPDPTCDKTRWLVGSEDGPKVEVTILVERLWWAVGEEDKEPSEWKDQPFTLPRDNFAATSKNALWLRLPRRRWADKVLVGFEQPKARPYDVRVTEKTIAVPLREFADSKEVGDRMLEYSLKVWIERGDGLIEGIVGNIPAESQKVPVEEKPLLHLDMIRAPRLATVLTCLRRATAGPLRVLIKEVRHKYFKSRPARQAESVEFKRYALCMIALSLELNPQIRGIKKRWVVKARLARNEFPAIMNHLRNRHKEISASCAYPARNIRYRR